MKSLAAVLLLVTAALACPGSADAKHATIKFRDIIIASGGDIRIPAEWDGIWTTSDSVYDCSGFVLVTDSGEDTLCAGALYTEEGPSGSNFDLTCKGTADATTAHITCTGSDVSDPECRYDVVSELNAVRTGETYRTEITQNITSSGTGSGCGGSYCIRIVTYGSRHDPAPPAYCATSTRATTWGKIKLIYR